MEQQNNIETPEAEEQQEHYVPRTVWQVWCARIGLVLFILFVIYQIIHVATGGQI